MQLFNEARVRDMLDRGLWSTDTWGDCFRRAVEARPEALAIVDAINKPAFMQVQPRRLTWKELDVAVRNLSELLYDRGLREGDVVGVQIPNCVELAVTYFAINRIGGIISPYPVLYRRHEISQLAAIAGVKYFVTTDGVLNRNLSEEIDSVIDDLPEAKFQFVWHGADRPGTVEIDLERILTDSVPETSDAAEYVASLKPQINDCVYIMFTSGTTGQPKGVPRAHCDTIFGGITNSSHPSLEPESVILNTLPMVNAGSLGGIFMPWLVTGCVLVQHNPFDLQVFLEQVEAEKVTYTLVAPTILNDMADNPDLFRRHDLSSLRTVGAGSAPLSGWAVEKWERDHGIEIINFFGASEGMQLTADRDTVPDPLKRGRCLPVPRATRFAWRQPIERQAHVKLVDVATGELITQPGQAGELRFSSPSTFSGYLNGAEEAFDSDGFYCSGDIFQYSADEPDMLIHIDRKKDLIIRGGLNISAAELETLLVGHAQVAEVAAVGRADRRLGERTCIFVVPRDPAQPPTLEDLASYLKGLGVATFKLPEFLEIIDVLPRNPSGKVLKRELRTLVNGEPSAVPQGA
jgi:acyl-CoA synthetase (AMP-forming)/AMP-acid ligase II